MRLERRGLERDWIERAVRELDRREPDPVDPDLERLYVAVPERGGRILRVGVSWPSDGEALVVAAHFDRSPGRRMG
jgi:hypothetical protein